MFIGINNTALIDKSQSKKKLREPMKYVKRKKTKRSPGKVFYFYNHS